MFTRHNSMNAHAFVLEQMTSRRVRLATSSVKYTPPPTHLRATEKRYAQAEGKTGR